MSKYDTMPVGREMDVEVAERILQIKVKRNRLKEYVYESSGGYEYEVEEYSYSSASFVLLNNWPGDWSLHRQNGMYHCELFEPSMQWDAWAETSALAICRARLKAVAS